MKKLLVVLVVAILALPSYAGIITDPGAGALQMTLTYDAAGNATLTNNTGSVLGIDGYEIWSTAGYLSPTTGWYSIEDAAAADFIGTATALGTGALSFGEFTATTLVLAEGSISNVAMFQPAVAWSIGQPINPGTLVGDLSFYYTTPEVVGSKFLGVISAPPIPEPATMVVLALGGLALLIRRR